MSFCLNSWNQGVSVLSSPWSEAPAYGTLKAGCKGDGISRTILEAGPHQRKDGVGIGIGHHEGSDPFGGDWEDFTLECRTALGADEERTCSGILIRGAANLRRIRIVGVRGRHPVEAFGVHQINRDPHGDYHGGGRIIDVEVIVLERGTYVTGMCISQREYSGIPLLETRVTRPEVVGPGGVWAAYTGLQKVVFDQPVCSGVSAGFNCDSGPMDGVSVLGPRWQVERSMIRLAVVTKGNEGPQYKRGLFVEGGVCRFRGPGPHRVIEAFDDEGTGLIGGIHFRNVVFDCDEGAILLALSSTAKTHGEITFTGCRWPAKTLVYLPHMDTSAEMLGRLRVDGHLLHAKFPRVSI